jgi:hypothetical protein
MPTRQPLRRLVRPALPCLPAGCLRCSTGHHLLSADDTRPIASPLDLLGAGIWVERIHVAGRSTIADEITDAAEERAECHVDVAENVEGEAVVEEDDGEKGEVG